MGQILRACTFLMGIVFSSIGFSSGAWAQQTPEVIPGEYLIKFKASAGGASLIQSKLSGKASLKAAFPGLGIYQVSMKVDASEKSHFESLKNDPDVEFVEPNYVLRKSEIEPNGPAQIQSYEEVVASGASTNANTYSQSSDTTGAASAWAASTSLSSSNSKVIVAVIDTGLERGHDVFKTVAEGGTGALWVNQIEAGGLPGVDDDQNGFVDDVNGWNFISNSNNFADDDNHGTHVAGIVVGAGQNIFSRPLVESKITVMPLKFLGAGGSGSTSNAIRAIYYAVDNGARIINNSWGGAGYSRALHEAIIYAYNHKVLVVSAAGNYSSNNDVTPMYPSNYDVPSNLSVASVSYYDDLSSFSNYGARTVHMGAPGEYIESTVPGNAIMKMSGTSMATPFVAGMAALSLREASGLSGYQLKQLILASVKSVNGLSGANTSGGRINSLALINSAKQMISTTSSQPAYAPSYLAERSPASEAPGAVGGCGLVKAITKDGPGSGKGSPSGMNIGLILGLLLAPLVVIQVLRSRQPQNKRKYERFKMSSEVRVKVGDRELIGAVNTISEGGLSFNADAALDKGGIVTMRIQSPDGNEVIEVQGQVVWSEHSQSYGVQFENTKQGTAAMIRDWTKGLIKT